MTMANEPFATVTSLSPGAGSSDTAASAGAGASSILSDLANPGIEADVANLMVNNSLSYSSMATILEDAAVGGMNASKFSTLQELASLLNVSGGIAVTCYVADITKCVVDGDPANLLSLGDLSATSTQTQATELIGKWFLGTDLPSMDVVTTLGYTNYYPTYQVSTNPLYGTSGVPSYSDVNQGIVGDCYFLASIAEVALEDPTAIESMITNDGNGVYGVRFLINGQAEYVTVNDELPVMYDGYHYANGSTLEFANGPIAWPELLEKAYAELNAEPNVPHGQTLDEAINAYAGIDEGYAGALSEITGQTVVQATTSAQIGAAWNANEELVVSTAANVSYGSLVDNHMFEVVGYDSSTGVLTLYNPWGTGYSPTYSSPAGLSMNVYMTFAQLTADGAQVWMTTGNAFDPASVTAASSVAVAEGKSIAASSLIASISNPNSDSITQYVFLDEGGGTGYFTVNGVKQADGAWFSAATFSSVQYIGGASPGTDTLMVGVYDATTNSYSYSSTISAITKGATSTSDYNGDGMSDLLWRSGGTFTVWQSNSNNTVTPNVDVWSVGGGWNVAGVGDFNGDGKSDLIYQNGATFTEWQSNGGGFNENVDVWSVASGWNVAGVGDFNGDGKSDLIYQNGATFTEWQSNGSGFNENVDVWSVASGWNIVGVGDFNGDGKSDLLFENGGMFTEWQSTGNGFTPNVYVGSLGAGWSVAAVGDFTGHGMDDILFRNTNGMFTEWQSTGNSFTQNVLVNSTVGTAWSLEYSPKGLA
jgi:hypothetical protein